MTTNDNKKALSGDTKTEILADEKDKVLHHYDGIVELNNPMPRWWLMLFYFGIVFGCGYFAYYNWGGGRSIESTFREERALLDSKLAEQSQRGPGDQQLLAALSDPGALDKGRVVYVARCVSCHGAQGQGGIGPNLTDDYWIHGAKLAEIAKTVSAGILDKGMPPWSAVLSSEELTQVVAYVKSLRGTHPPQPKAPQGTLVRE